jgi:hypothetical protein
MRSQPDNHPEAATCRVRAVTNQFAFEMHRHYLELELRQAKPIPPCASYVDPLIHYTIWYTGLWMGRYMRRLDAIEGVFDGPLADAQAKRLLIARHQARDANNPSVPDWDPLVLSMVNTCLQNTSRTINKLDVSSITELHRYGPSLRALWGQAKRLGRSDAEAWEFIVAWGRHRPACWDREDEGKKNGQPLGPPALLGHLARKRTWKRTGDLDHPWATAEAGGQDWQVRLNDFPDDVMYSLVIDGTPAGDFHDWPATWQRR